MALLDANAAIRSDFTQGDNVELESYFELVRSVMEQGQQKLQTQLVINLTKPLSGRIVTFCKLRFRPMLLKWCLCYLKTRYGNETDAFLSKLAKALSIDLAGKTIVVENDDDDDNDQLDNQDDGWTFQGYVDLIFRNTPLTATQTAILQDWKTTNNREGFLLHGSILTDHHEHWIKSGWKSWVSVNLLTVLKFFHQVNGIEFSQQFFVQPNVKNSYLQLTTTILGFLWARFLKQSKRKPYENAVKRYLATVNDPSLRKCKNGQKWARHPTILWNTVFPGIQRFQTLHNNLLLQFSGQTDGKALHVLFANQNTQNAHKEDSAAVTKHGQEPTEFNSKDFRYYDNNDLSSLVGTWNKGTDEALPNGLKSIDGYKGIIQFDKFATYFTNDISAAKELLDTHPIVGIDLGVDTHVSMVTLNGTIDEHDNGGFDLNSTWIEKLFKGRAAYASQGIDDYMEPLIQQQQPHVERLSEYVCRTNDTEEYLDYANVFKQVSPLLIENSYSTETLNAKFYKDRRKESYYRSIANRILSQCHAIAPDKKGAPILVIGNPTFSATMKGHRAACPKLLIKYLSRFFTVIIVNEYNTSKLCCQCCVPLESFQDSIRFYQCAGGCQRSNGGGPLIVNKDRSAALAMIRIFITLLATGSRPPMYCPPGQL